VEESNKKKGRKKNNGRIKKYKIFEKKRKNNTKEIKITLVGIIFFSFSFVSVSRN
jgi:hypothetical protein